MNETKEAKAKLWVELDTLPDTAYEDRTAILKQIIQLQNIEQQLRDADSKPSLFMNPAIIAAVTNIFGILIVLNYEKVDIVTSKAFGMIYRSK